MSSLAVAIIALFAHLVFIGQGIVVCCGPDCKEGRIYSPAHDIQRYCGYCNKWVHVSCCSAANSASYDNVPRDAVVKLLPEEMKGEGVDEKLLALAFCPVTRGGNTGVVGNGDDVHKVRNFLKARLLLRPLVIPDWRVELSVGWEDADPRKFTYFLCPMCETGWI